LLRSRNPPGVVLEGLSFENSYVCLPPILEYKVDDDRSLILEQYRNSVFGTTRYLGGAWLPLEFGPLRVGAIAGLADGYPKMRNGGFFPVILPC
jgi:hypothetical protein